MIFSKRKHNLRPVKAKLPFLIPTLIVMANLCLLFGCADKQMTCERAQAAYATYLAIVQAGGEPSKTETQIAVGAAAFLTAYCGWSSPIPAGPSGARSAVAVTDSRGVPVVVPPSFQRAAIQGRNIPVSISEGTPPFGDAPITETVGDWKLDVMQPEQPTDTNRVHRGEIRIVGPTLLGHDGPSPNVVEEEEPQ